MKHDNLSYDYKIINVITTADLKQLVDTPRFNRYEWGRYDIINNYNGSVGYVKDKFMEGRTSVFLSGKMISTGGGGLEKSIQQLYQTKKILVQEDFIQDIAIEPKIRNIVSTFDFKKPIDFNYFINKRNVIYEPEQFPGIIYKSSFGPTCLIFSSGKIVIAGAKAEKDIVKVLQEIENIL